MRDRVNEAWHSIQAGLITGVSIGFRPLADGIKELASGGLHFLKTEICELSLVTVPANIETTIQTIKSYDAPYLAASGPTPPGVSGLPHETTHGKPTAAEQIQNLENKRAATAGAHDRHPGVHRRRRRDAGRRPGRRTRPAWPLKVKSLDADLQRWRELERHEPHQGDARSPTTAPAQPAPVTTVPRITVKPNVPIGTRVHPRGLRAA